MAEDTEQFIKLETNNEKESHFKGLSIRSLIALMICTTGCVLTLAVLLVPGVVVPSDFMVFWSGVISFYFGKQTGQKESTKVSSNDSASIK